MDLLLSTDRWSRLVDIRNFRLNPRFSLQENMLLRLELPQQDPKYPWGEIWWGGTILAVGSTGFVAVVPSRTQHGDLICQFYGSRGAAVLREYKDKYQVIGRAGVLLHIAVEAELGEAEWDLPLDIDSFDDSNSEVVSLRMNLRMLTALSLNSYALPGTVHT